MNVTIDQVNLRNEMGIGVVSQQGKLRVGTRKGTTSFSFPDEHGEVAFVDKEDIRLEPNTIELTCVLYGSSTEEFMKRYKAFKKLLEKAGLRQLKVPQMDGTIHEVYVSEGARINIQGKWKQGQIVSNEFTIPFIEPNPLAEAISFVTDSTIGVTGTILTTDQGLIVDHGEGTRETIASGANNMDFDYSGSSGDKQVDVTFKKSLEDVTEITLDSYGFKGSIPEELGGATSLATLDLNTNSLDTYERTYWHAPDGLTIDVSDNTTLDATEVSNWLIDLANPRADMAIIQNGTFTATGCNGGSLTYSDLTTDGQAAHDKLETNGWTMNLDI